MTLELFFLGCFAFGTIFTVAMGLLGALGATVDLDVPHPSGTGPLHGGSPAGHVHHFWHLLNTSSMLAFLMFFGAVGYLSLRAGHGLGLAVGAAVLTGLGGAWAMAALLGWLRAGTRWRSAEEDRPEGTLGQVSVSLPENGVGEVVFHVAGVQRNEAARCPSGLALPKGTEVLIVGEERGVVLVEPWNRLLNARAGAVGLEAPSPVPRPQREEE